LSLGTPKSRKLSITSAASGGHKNHKRSLKKERTVKKVSPKTVHFQDNEALFVDHGEILFRLLAE
jgi:hypothetical protein